MRFHILEHMPYERPGRLLDWAKRYNHEVTTTRFHAGDSLPKVKDVDFLVVMGGPMSVHDENKYPWMKDEKHFMRNAMHRGTKVLGICLGAQLAAECLGAKITPNKTKEIGWLPIEKVKSHPVTQDLPSSLTVFHWHGETFSLPAHAVHLFESKHCPHQAFLWNDQVLGLQFHMEMNDSALADFQPHIMQETQKTSPSIQSWETIDKAQASHINQLGPLFDKLLNRFIETESSPLIKPR